MKVEHNIRVKMQQRILNRKLETGSLQTALVSSAGSRWLKKRNIFVWEIEVTFFCPRLDLMGYKEVHSAAGGG